MNRFFKNRLFQHCFITVSTFLCSFSSHFYNECHESFTIRGVPQFQVALFTFCSMFFVCLQLLPENAPNTCAYFKELVTRKDGFGFTEFRFNMVYKNYCEGRLKTDFVDNFSGKVDYPQSHHHHINHSRAGLLSVVCFLLILWPCMDLCYEN